MHLARACEYTSTKCAGNLVEPGKMKDALLMYFNDPVAYLQLNQYIPGHWMEIGNK